jgi:hypothetical protein
MEFMRSGPDVVQSAHQCWLLNYWNKLRGTAKVPSWRGVAVDQLGAVTEHLSYLDVVGSDSTARFRIRFHGTGLARAYGATCAGRFLDELLPASFREVALATYRQVVESQRPVYTVADMRDANARIVHYERLLLPFSYDGQTVDRIVSSLETSSPEGKYEHRDLMIAPGKPPAFALCTMIEH